MKILFSTATSVEKDAVTVLPSLKVCMHVLGAARTDMRVMREATALVEAGFSVSIVDVESERTRPVEEDIRGVYVKHIIVPSWYTSRHFEPWFFVKAVQVLILSILRMIQTSADVYHAHDLRALPACYIAARLRCKPLIFDAHELDWPMPETDVAFWRPLGRLLMHLLPHCAAVITVSPPIAQKMCQLYNLSEVSVIRNVPAYRVVSRTDRLRQYLGLSSHVRIALYQGEFHPNRGLDRVIRAAPFLDQNIVVVLMGKGLGTAQAQLEALIASEGVAERVRIVPSVPYEELLEWTASADIGLLVSPLDYSLNVRWSLPNKLFEYLMAGLPVLTSELDAVAEVVKAYDVGRVVSSLAPADVGAAINAVLANHSDLARMSHNAQEAAQQEFCWERERQKLVTLYQGIVSEKSTESSASR